MHRSGCGSHRGTGEGPCGTGDESRRGNGCGSRRGNGRGSRRGSGRGCHCGTSRGRGIRGGRSLGVTSENDPADQHNSVEDALPTIGITWENEEPQALQYVYIDTPGSNIPFSDSSTAVSLFYRFFTEEVWDLLVTVTNRYAALNQSGLVIGTMSLSMR